LGWAGARNARLDGRWTAGNVDAARKYGTELVALAREVIVTDTSFNVAAMQQATRTVPIVFGGVIDPVGAGLVDSLARPGGNTTGFTAFEYAIAAKWLELQFVLFAPHRADDCAQPLLRLSVPNARLRRESVGVLPVVFWDSGVNEVVLLKPTSSPISVTDSLRCASKLLARSMRLLVRYRCGGMPSDSLNAREKWNGLSCASSANDDSEMSSARCSSMYCTSFFCCQLGSPPRTRDTRGETLSFMRMSSYANAMLSAST